MPQIMVSDEDFARLKVKAEPFIDKDPGDVVRKLLDFYEDAHDKDSPDLKTEARSSGFSVVRRPRQRGCHVILDGQSLEAITVGDLYRQALAYLVENYEENLNDLLPFKTSELRYLVALEPQHPSGRSFVSPVEVKGYYAESHKNYQNAVQSLQRLCGRMGIDLDYVS